MNRAVYVALLLLAVSLSLYGQSLQPGSPFVDSGTFDGASATDSEGRRQPCGTGVDIGAYESGDCPRPFIRGDANADGERNVADIVSVLAHLFDSGKELPCAKSADANDSGTVDLTDAIFLLNFLFSGGPPPPAPFFQCGPDPTIDDLSCAFFAACSERSTTFAFDWDGNDADGLPGCVVTQIEFRFTSAVREEVSTIVDATITVGTNEIAARDALRGVPEGDYDVFIRLVDIAGQRSDYSDLALPIRVYARTPSTPTNLSAVGK